MKTVKRFPVRRYGIRNRHIYRKRINIKKERILIFFFISIVFFLFFVMVKNEKIKIDLQKAAKYLCFQYGKIAVCTFCPAGLYDNNIMYYGEDVLVALAYRTAFPIVDFMCLEKDSSDRVKTGDEEGRIEIIIGENTIKVNSTAMVGNHADAVFQNIIKNEWKKQSADILSEVCIHFGRCYGVAHMKKEIFQVADQQKNDNPVETQNTILADIHTNLVATQKQCPIPYEKLMDYSYLHDNYYIFPPHTDLLPDVLVPSELLKMDMSVVKEEKNILIYHTHGTESFRDSSGDNMSIIQVGDYLAEILEKEYGIKVIHIRKRFDMMGGGLDRSRAYSFAEEEIGQYISEHPEIDMVIDLHRDGVNDNVHLVTQVNGKSTAKLMFFNGISYSNAQGKIDYLTNPYIKENLALTSQMYTLSETYYPGLVRGIYVEAYRYNLHLHKRCMLIEAGAQTNTFEEVKNSMEPLAEIIARELYGEKAAD